MKKINWVEHFTVVRGSAVRMWNKTKYSDDRHLIGAAMGHLNTVDCQIINSPYITSKDKKEIYDATN